MIIEKRTVAPTPPSAAGAPGRIPSAKVIRGRSTPIAIGRRSSHDLTADWPPGTCLPLNELISRETLTHPLQTHAPTAEFSKTEQIHRCTIRDQPFSGHPSGLVLFRQFLAKERGVAVPGVFRQEFTHRHL